MNTVLEIERAIGALSPNELDELYTWMDQNCPIDVQLKTDLDAGRLDDRIARALADHRAGNTHKRQLQQNGIAELRALWHEAREKNGPYVAADEVMQRLERKYQAIADAAGETEG